jgi:hypothetical protein
MKTIVTKVLFVSFACFTVLCLTSAATSGGKILKKWIKGEGPIIERKVDLGEISGLSLAVSADVFLTQGTNREVKISGQENILDNLELTNEESVLKIGQKENVTKAEPVKIYITLPAIDLIKISGSGDVHTTSHFNNLKDLKVGISGSGNVDADLDGEKIVASISGSGNISLLGKAEALDISIAGSGNVNAKELKVREAEISVSGSGDAAVNASERLKGHVSGSGNISYLGDPSVNCHTAGSGSVYKIR